tara:strand:+ start:940 stop:1110 length:171 start_codon:yes stop_codon:yes gene_type:complete
MKKRRRPQASKIWEHKPRNFIAKSLKTDSEFRPRVIKDKTKNKRPKYPLKVDTLDD